MKKSKLVIVTICICVLLTSCLPQQKIPVDRITDEVFPMRDKTEIVYKGNSDIETGFKDIDLYFDMSASMRGYFCKNNSRFVKTINGLEVTAKTIINQRKEGNVKYFRFGEGVEAVSSTNVLTDWHNYDYNHSKIDYAIQNIDITHLNVILTDLAIGSDNIDALINKMGSEYISKGYSIGIVGIKSEYEGYVYSLEDENDKVVYCTDNSNPENDFPFYLLILGQQNDITKFYEDMKYFCFSDFEDCTYNYTLVPLASTGLISKVVDDVKIQPLNEFSEVFIEEEFLSGNKDKQYLINRTPKGEVGFSITGLSYEMVKYAPEIKADMKYTAELYFFDNQSKKWTLDADGEEILKATNTSSPDKFKAEYVLNTDKMLNDVAYSIKTNVYFTQGDSEDKVAFTTPDWINNWNMDTSNIPVWKEEYKAFKDEVGESSSSEIAKKYKSWLDKNEIESKVLINTTKDLEKLFKKMVYFVNKGEDTNIYQNIFYIKKNY